MASGGSETNTTSGYIITDLLSQLTPQVAYLGKGAADGSASNTILQPNMKTLAGTKTPLSSAPNAYLNYMVLDNKSFKAVQLGFVIVPQKNKHHGKAATAICLRQ